MPSPYILLLCDDEQGDNTMSLVFLTKHEESSAGFFTFVLVLSVSQKMGASLLGGCASVKQEVVRFP